MPSTHSLRKTRSSAAETQKPTEIFVGLAIRDLQGCCLIVGAKSASEIQQISDGSEALSLTLEQDNAVLRDPGIPGGWYGNGQGGFRRHQELRLGGSQCVCHFLHVVSGRSARNHSTYSIEDQN